MNVWALLPVISIILAILGIIMAIKGLKKVREQQKLLDIAILNIKWELNLEEDKL